MASRRRTAEEPEVAEGAEAFKTEQEKDSSGDVPGVGPASPSELSPGPVETMEAMGIGPRQPYPTGGAPKSDADPDAED